MTKQKTTAPEYITREILKEEINRLDTKIDGVEKRLVAKIDGVEQRLDAKIDGVEQRLDAKIDSKVDAAVQSMKDYTDSRFNQLERKMDGFEQKLDEQGNKMDRYFNGIVKMIEGLTGTIAGDEEHLKDHACVP